MADPRALGRRRGLRDARRGSGSYGADMGIRQGTGETVSGPDIAGLVVGIGMLGYLIYALIRPDRF